MLDCLLCKPLLSMIHSLFSLSSGNDEQFLKKQISLNKKHKRNQFSNNDPLLVNSEFIQKYNSLNHNNKELQLKNDDSFLPFSDTNNINDIIESIKHLVGYMELYGNILEEYTKKLNELSARINNKYAPMKIETENKHKFQNNAYNCLKSGFEGIPKQNAIIILNKLDQALENILPYVGYIALSTWKKNYSRDKLKKIHVIYLYLLFARKELKALKEYYTNNEDNSLIKKKAKSLWWALNSAKKQSDNFKTSTNKKIDRNRNISSVYFQENEPIFNQLKNCYLDSDQLIKSTNETLQYFSHKILKTLTDE